MFRQEKGNGFPQGWRLAASTTAKKGMYGSYGERGREPQSLDAVGCPV